MAFQVETAAIHQPSSLPRPAAARSRKGQAGFGNIMNGFLREKGDAPTSGEKLAAAAAASAGVPPPVASQANAKWAFLLKAADFIKADSTGTASTEEILNSQADEVASADMPEAVQAAGTTEETATSEAAKPKTMPHLVSDLEGWEKDFLAKALGNPDYLPKDPVEAWKSSQIIASDLAEKSTANMNGLFEGNYEKHRWLYCGVAYVDGEYLFEPRAYMAQSGMNKVIPQKKLTMPWEREPLPKPSEWKWFPADDVFEAAKIIYDKLSITVQKPGYQELAERYAVDEAIFWLASTDKEFAEEYELNPQGTVSKYSKELVRHMASNDFNANYIG